MDKEKNKKEDQKNGDAANNKLSQKHSDPSKNPLEYMQVVLNEVYLPMIENTKNQKNWPKVVTQDVLRQFHRFLGLLTLFVGETKGSTILPVPPIDDLSSEKSDSDRAMVHALESALIDWSKQIKKVVENDTEKVLNASEQRGQYHGPLFEIEFWFAKMINLKNLHQQLHNDKISLVLKILEKSKSSYVSGFKKIVEELNEALEEAEQVYRHLIPLKPYIEDLNNPATTPVEYPRLFRIIMHMISLMWCSLKNPSNVKLIVLLREICNDIINQVYTFVDPSSLWQSELEECNSKLRIAINACNSFKDIFFEYEKKVNEKCPENQWKFENITVFSRLNRFIERLQDLLDIVMNIQDFSHLEKIEIGGIKGESLGLMMQQVLHDFSVIQEKIQNLEYDPLDLETSRFEQDISVFSEAIKDFDKRLSYVISKGFQSASTAAAAFKVLETFECHMRRDLIRQEIESKYEQLVQLYSKDLNAVFVLFSERKDNPPILSNLPKVAGSLVWLNGLMERITWPMERLKRLKIESEEMETVKKKFDYLTRKMKDHADGLYNDWASQIEQISTQKLNESLLKRSGNNLVVNFDRILSACIQEVKYLGLANVKAPDSVNDVYKNKESFRSYVGQLEMITRQYNTMIQTMLPVEKPLIHDKLSNIDNILEQAVSKLNWNSENISEFTEIAQKSVKDLYNKLNFLKGNVKTVEKLISSWMKLNRVITVEKVTTQEMYKPPKIMKTIAFWRNKNNDSDTEECSLTYQVFTQWKSNTSVKITKFSDVIEQGQRIHNIIATSREKIQANECSEEWREYTKYLNQLVSDGLYESIKQCLKYLIDSFQYVVEMKDFGDLNTSSLTPLLQAKLELLNNDAVFTPEINGNEDSVQDTVKKWMDRIFKVAGSINRLDNPSENYLQHIVENEELKNLREAVNQLLDITISKMGELRNTYRLKYTNLWTNNPKEELERFLTGQLDDSQLAAEDFEEDLDGDNRKAVNISLEEFEIQIVKYEKIQEELQEYPEVVSFGWIVVDTQPLRQAILNFSRKWRLVYLDRLVFEVSSKLQEFNQFVERLSKGLTQEMPKDSYPKLVEMMGYLLELKKKSSEYGVDDKFLIPLKDIVALLKKYEIKVSPQVMEQLEEVPIKWKTLCKISYEIKDKLSALQTQEIKRIGKVEALFNESAESYQIIFSKTVPDKFEVGVDKAYKTIDDINEVLSEHEEKLRSLRSKQNLFGLMLNQGKPIKDCRLDLKLVKHIWDVISLVKTQIEDWENIPLLDVDVNDIEDKVKIFLKEIRYIDKRGKQWDIYKGLEEMLGTFQVTLPLIRDLRKPGMKERHWYSLMDKTKVRFELNSNFTLKNLLALHLERCLDDVNEIVERAGKEMQMEKQFNDLERVWSSLTLEFETRKDGIKLLKLPEEAAEFLEDHQSLIQQMGGSKYIDYFLSELTSWQEKLGKVDTTVNLAVEVEKTWAYLETIFIGSDDIRQQLPQYSKLFDEIDVKIKEILKKAEQVPNIVEFSSISGLAKDLNKLQEDLNVCEHKLASYLEEKKKAFPRFYFVSVPDLLDILSKGGKSPHQIMKHMHKLFQAIERIEFQKDENGNLTNYAIAMVSREGERVEFDKPYLLEGKVEVWLEKLEIAIKHSLRVILGEAVSTYEEGKRELWLNDYPSQIVLVACQIYWTNEVNAAFDALEDNENAMKDYNQKQINQLNVLISEVQKKLDAGRRQKIMNLVTIDVHSRDVVGKLVKDKVMYAQSFAWQSQLRQRWDDQLKDCIIEICDASFRYGYEYLGNGPRLVITPLTDRIYITLTQSLHLIMGGAPAGPAGTGKTETTKDLGSQLGKPVYVFNCVTGDSIVSLSNCLGYSIEQLYLESKNHAPHMMNQNGTTSVNIQHLRLLGFKSVNIVPRDNMHPTVQNDRRSYDTSLIPNNERSPFAHKTINALCIPTSTRGKALIHHRGKQRIKRITLLDGTIVKCTPDHRLLVIRSGQVKPQYVTASQLIVGDQVIRNESPVTEHLPPIRWLLQKFSIEDREEVFINSVNVYEFQHKTGHELQSKHILPLYITEVDRISAIARLSGFVMTNGNFSKHIIEKLEHYKCHVFVGSLKDVEDVQSDVCCVLKNKGLKLKYRQCRVREYDTNSIAIRVSLPVMMVELLCKACQIPMCSKLKKDWDIPPIFAFSPHLWIKREFFSGMWGGAATVAAFHTSTEEKYVMSVVGAIVSIMDNYSDENIGALNLISRMMQSLGFSPLHVLRKVKISNNPLYCTFPSYDDLEKFETTIRLSYACKKRREILQLMTFRRYQAFRNNNRIILEEYMKKDRNLRHLERNDERRVNNELTDSCMLQEFSSMITSDVLHSHIKLPIIAIGIDETENTYDISIDKDDENFHNFEVNGVVVHNCSDQMDNKSLGDIFKGLASSGSWGCFDEFNRIAVEVLSVVSTQFKSILDAIKEKKSKFLFEGDEIRLDPTVGVFITMNPGYLGRTELPESLKALFRPVTVVVPDLELICENMLMAEGFMNARVLAKKFITLYNLNKDLLSKQDHYDWGLRSIKSVLVVAGELKRSEPEINEDHILMRALRDFNLPKIVSDDLTVFKGLIEDLFPNVRLPRKVDEDFESIIKDVIQRSGYQVEDNLVLKIVQLAELLFVRHSVFIIGPAGSGKSACWKVLAEASGVKGGKKVTVRDIDPKSITSNELYGYFSESNGEWRDGLLSSIMRDLANMENKDPKWIILDGDLDTEWIESMNSVMDDNRILTLANNDRIPLHPHMRLIFEIFHLKYATPATVSRAGILYISERDIGWQPYIASWIDKRPKIERGYMPILVEKYVAETLQHIRKEYKHIIPISDFNMVHSLCQILEGLLTEEKNDKEIYEQYFVFGCVWAFGGALSVKDKTNYRVQFDKWWRATWKSVKFPEQGIVFDYFINPSTNKFEKWKEKVEPFVAHEDMNLSNVMVSTEETICTQYFINLLVSTKKPIMLVGNAGCGKTKLVQQKLLSLNSAETDAVTINFNYYTDARTLQKIMEQHLEKKGPRRYGPLGNKNLIFFIDDLNMPALDKYETQSPIALLRQHINYGHWFERGGKWPLKEIIKVQYIACLNPTAGSFIINPRLQRHFVTFAVNFPQKTSLLRIYHSILDSHMRSFSNLSKISETISNAALELHEKVALTFQKNAVNFHYEFNMRHLSNVFEGLLRSDPVHYKQSPKLIRLWIHESYRVYADRLVNDTHLKTFATIVKGVTTQYFADQVEKALLLPNFFTYFANGTQTVEKIYDEFKSIDDLNNVLVEALKDYNRNNAEMNLVLFEDAMSHVCRISRILEGSNGNALLVGVGGSGKQSLSKLAAFICDLEVYRITITRGYNVENLKENLREIYRKSGLKSQKMAFILTDTQIVDEKFLVYINDLLSSGNIPDLFSSDEKDEITQSNELKTAMKSMGNFDLSRDSCWRFFIEQVRRNLHVILCFSPVGDMFRIRSRRFPALVNCTVIDWFFPWPEEALLSVAHRFLKEEKLGQHHEAIVKFVAFAHQSVNEASGDYKVQLKRHTYTTPKSFLELIQLYKSMLGKQKTDIRKKIVRLDSGIVKLRQTSEDVAKLEEKLKKQSIIVEEKKAAADKKLTQVSKDRQHVQNENEKAKVEEEKAIKMAEIVAAQKADCEKDLEKAIPIIEAAEKALDTLKAKELTEMRTFKKPPSEVVEVCSAVLILLSPKSGVTRDRSWGAAQKAMQKGGQAFLDVLKNYNKEGIAPAIIQALEPYLKNPNFNSQYIQNKSQAAAGLCDWVRNIVEYYRIYSEVEPKRQKLAEAEEQQREATEKLAKMKKRVDNLAKKLKKLEIEFERDNNEKMKVIADAQQTEQQLNLAQRLVKALASENVRWMESIKQLQEKEVVLIGDVLLAAAFVSYAGSFDIKFRMNLSEKWGHFLNENKIPCSKDVTPISILADDAEIAAWNNEQLPSDQTSIENGCILTNCERWPLIIDPQLQGITWLKNRYGESLIVMRLGQKGLLETLERAITEGRTVLIENIGESIDAVLAPILSRNIIWKGSSKMIKLENEVDYNENFKLIFHTKLSNPHYNPETQAETTLINFSVTQKGLEEQLLALVVKKEREDLEKKIKELIMKQNEYKIKLKELEDNLLESLQNSGDDILTNVALIENLEKTKETSIEIKQQVEIAKQTEQNINSARENYRTVADRGAILYFLLDQLKLVQDMYQFSLSAFTVVFNRAMGNATSSGDLSERINNLINAITLFIFNYTNRGIFERHKLIFSTNLCLKVMESKLNPEELDYLVIGKKVASPPANPFPDWLSEESWQALNSLKELKDFSKLLDDIIGSSKRWKTWTMAEAPEKEKLPQDWKNKSDFQRLLIIRALRPDRLTQAVTSFVHDNMGTEYVNPPPFSLDQVFSESNAGTPLFFILFPGADPIREIENLGKKLGFSEENDKFFNISMGKGQEKIAEDALKKAYENGGWVVLQNIHLMKNWLPTLERSLENYSEGSHKDFRVFLTAEPTQEPTIPQSILQNAIKITNEPPQNLQANLYRAFSNFNQDFLESCNKTEFKTILFALCYFHSLVLGRRKFGFQGWSRSYSFNMGDLTISANVLFNYLEQNDSVPWEDLRYMFGEIMYGGHITDKWDRRTCSTYLETLMKDELFEEMELSPGFKSPGPMNYNDYIQYIHETLPDESPILFGLHPNAEIGFLTNEAEALFSTIITLRGGISSASGTTKEERVAQRIEEIMSSLPDVFDLKEISDKAEKKTPYVVVVLQECERMTILLSEIKRSLRELQLGLKGELTMSELMDQLLNELVMEKVPETWTKIAYPSLKSLAFWIDDVIKRYKQLEEWSSELILPKTVWLSGLFNPMSFLTAVMQTTARKNGSPLDMMCLQTEVLKKHRDELQSAPRDGCYIDGLFLEGAGWDLKASVIRPSMLKELRCEMPVIHVRAVTVDKKEQKGVYECPVYTTSQRGATYVFSAQLRTKDPASKWVLAGVALLLQK